MRVTIIDLDWYYGHSKVPNPKCQKLSSYYKQLGSIVNFPLNNIEASLVSDVVYVVREGSVGDIPTAIHPRDEKVNLIGDSFEFYDRYVPDIAGVVKACRPDYLLYPDTPEIAEGEVGPTLRRTNILQFFDGDTKLPKVQDSRQGEGRGPLDNKVIDDSFWSKPTKDIADIVDTTLSKRKNLIFGGDISVCCLMEDPVKLSMFSKLHHRRSGHRCNFTIKSPDEMSQVSEMLKYFKDANTNLNKPNIVFTLGSPQNEAEFLSTYDDALAVGYAAKWNKINLTYRAAERDGTPYWDYFEDLEAWSRYAFDKSFIEHMTYLARFMKRQSIEGVIYSNKWWGDRAERLRNLIALVPVTLGAYGYLEWGNRSYPNKIDFRRMFE